MTGSLVADLGLGPEAWLALTLLAFLTLFFKFDRIWSVRNLDLLLLFAPAMGLMRLVGGGGAKSSWAFPLLFLGTALWLIRCLLDLGLSRRPLLEPNLNAAGLTCVAIGVAALLVAETISLPVDEGAARNPADPTAKSGARHDPPPVGSTDRNAPVNQVLSQAPLPRALKRNPPQVILSRVIASAAHVALVVTLIAVGVRHFERPIAGLCGAVGYLLSPYTRIELVDSGQLLPAALIVSAILYYQRPLMSGLLIGLAAGWMPPCLGLVPLWFGFYRTGGAWRFSAAALGVIGTCALLASRFPELAVWARALGARSLAEAGLVPTVEAPHTGSVWSQIDPSYRLPVLIAYAALVLAVSFLPARKNLGELIALSAALLVASQFWYLEAGGTMVLLVLPLILLLVFRPNLGTRRPVRPVTRSRRSRQAVTPLL